MEQQRPTINYRANIPPQQEPIQNNRVWSKLLPRLALRFKLSESMESVAGEANQTEVQRGQFIQAFDQISRGEFTDTTAYPLLQDMISSGLNYYSHFFRNHPEQGDQYRVGKEDWRNVPNQFTMPDESSKYRESFGPGYDLWHKLNEANSEAKAFEILPTLGANKNYFCGDMEGKFLLLHEKNEQLVERMINKEKSPERRKLYREMRAQYLTEYQSDVNFGGNSVFDDAQYKAFNKAKDSWQRMKEEAGYQEELAAGTRLYGFPSVGLSKIARPGDSIYNAMRGRLIKRSDIAEGGSNK